MVLPNKFIGNRPVSLNSKTFDNNKKYYLTLKYDGYRFLISLGKENYTVSSKGEHKKIVLPKTSESLKGTLLDGEYIKGKYYIFDILFYNYKDVRNLKFSERKKLFEKSVKILKSKKVESKEFFCCYSKNLFTQVKEKYKNSKIEVDGIMFVPDESYYSPPALKWKSPEKITIDFKISKKEGKILLIKSDDKPYITKFKVKEMPKKEYDRLKDSKVYEFYLLNNEWVIGKLRPDKVKSNHITTINSNLFTISENDQFF